MGRVLLLRHGQSTWNAQGRWQGWADPPLSDAGETQAKAAAALLAGFRFDRVVSSDLERARRTAEIISAELDLGDVLIEEGLRERDVGEWSGKTRPEIDELWPGAMQAWREGRLERPPGGESVAEMTARIIPTIERLSGDEDAGGMVLALTHGGVIHLVERHYQGDQSATANLCGRWVARGPRLGDVFAFDHGAPTTIL
ncbi:MAG: 2,3-bisphosphoglycerate-dependent phosphoglycerate mutase [Actinomycetota bacterium]|nr:2,3-bisphosphoglycerate-dependent phosphoglycerate mutase [Actinomycetota bacterium]